MATWVGDNMSVNSYPKKAVILMTKLTMLGLVLGLICPLALAEPALHIADPWSPEAPPGRMMAGFMELHNASDQAIRLVDAASPLFGHVEIHTMFMDDGVMRMRRLDELVIEPGQSVSLRPGGLHLMLIEPLEPQEPLAAGDRIAIELLDDQGRAYQLEAEVRVRQRPSRVD